MCVGPCNIHSQEVAALLRELALTSAGHRPEPTLGACSDNSRQGAEVTPEGGLWRVSLPPGVQPTGWQPERSSRISPHHWDLNKRQPRPSAGAKPPDQLHQK